MKEGMLMSEYLNEEFCDFNNDASATSFGCEYSTYSEPHRPALRATHSII